jgi:hypothetical protein
MITVISPGRRAQELRDLGWTMITDDRSVVGRLRSSVITSAPGSRTIARVDATAGSSVIMSALGSRRIAWMIARRTAVIIDFP